MLWNGCIRVICGFCCSFIWYECLWSGGLTFCSLSLHSLCFKLSSIYRETYEKGTEHKGQGQEVTVGGGKQREGKVVRCWYKGTVINKKYKGKSDNESLVCGTKQTGCGAKGNDRKEYYRKKKW